LSAIIPPPIEVISQGKPLIVTKHALKQFESRWRRYVSDKHGSVPKDFTKTLTKLLNKSSLEPAGSPGRVIRIMNHGFKPMEFRINEKWRFVILINNEDKRILVTAERIFKK